MKDIYKYRVLIEQIDTTDGVSYIAKFPDVRGCVGGGDTPMEALEEAYDNLKFHLG